MAGDGSEPVDEVLLFIALPGRDVDTSSWVALCECPRLPEGKPSGLVLRTADVPEWAVFECHMDWPDSVGLDERERQAVAAVAQSCEFGPRDIVFHEGDDSSSVHLITSGHFAVRVTTPDGDRATLNVLGPGGWFGELPVTDGSGPSRRSATVLSLDESSTLVLNLLDFQSLCSEHPRMGRLVQALMAARIRELSAQLLQSMYVPLDRRLCCRLLDLLEVYPARGGSTVLPLTQDQIADLVGGTRSSVNQALQQLVNAQIIELGRGRVVVRDRPALERAAAV